MEEALRAKLLANTAIAALIQRVAWIDRPDLSALPAITLMQIGAGRNYLHCGADRLIQPLVQFDFWAASQDGAVELERLVTAEMETASVHEGVMFDPAFLEAQQDFDPEDIDGGGRVYRRISDWRINYTI